jgi:hypothetical protein
MAPAAPAGAGKGGSAVKTRSLSGWAGPEGGPVVEIVVTPGNVALVSPPAEGLAPLLEYRNFVLDDVRADELPDEEAAGGPGSAAPSAFPAGLAPRLRDALAAGGYRVGVDDGRVGQGPRVNGDLYRGSLGEARPLVRAAAVHPLGQVQYETWDDMVWRLAVLCWLCPEGRTLVAADVNMTAGMLYDYLGRTHRVPVGLLAREWVRTKARCLASTLAMLPKLRRGRWDVVLLPLFNSRILTEATWRAVVRLRARRVYALVPYGLRLGRVTRLRLEAMAGGLIAPLLYPPVDWWRRGG